MKTTTALRLVPEQEQCTVSFEMLCGESKIAARGRDDVRAVIDEILSRHNVANAFNREVLTCGIFANIKKRCLHCSLIPYSVENATEWVRVLLHYKVPYMKAMEIMRAQYHFEDYSPKSRFLYAHIGETLGKRSRPRARKSA